jgi:hypothetical protein
VHHHSSSTEVADLKGNPKAAGFTHIKTHELGEGAHAYSEPVGQFVVVPQLFPMVSAHAIFAEDYTQVSNKTPFGQLHLIFKSDGSKRYFTLINNHSANLSVKHNPPKAPAAANDNSEEYLREHLGTFHDADTVVSGESREYAAEGNYTLRSTSDPKIANTFTIDFVRNKVYLVNGNPAGAIQITLEQ